ncbi:MAG: hypothetical protein EOO20_14040 [Chryseobacterium sp.]|nr:MAG: hypothetical protein EOO20_14040 [Chryseobacterium sp.]
MKSHPVISVRNGAAIYSLDESFNEQILKSNMVKDGTTTVAKNSDNRVTLTIQSPQKKAEKNTPARSLIDSSQLKREKENLKEVKKHLETIKAAPKKQVFMTPFSSENVGNSSYSKNYVNISLNHTDHRDFAHHQACFEIQKHLNFLESQKINSYNSQSLGYTVISHLKVRPPPAA